MVFQVHCAPTLTCRSQQQLHEFSCNYCMKCVVLWMWQKFVWTGAARAVGLFRQRLGVPELHNTCCRGNQMAFSRAICRRKFRSICFCHILWGVIFSIAVIEKGKKKGKNRKNEKNIEKDSDLGVWLIEVISPCFKYNLNFLWLCWMYFWFQWCFVDSNYLLYKTLFFVNSVLVLDCVFGMKIWNK